MLCGRRPMITIGESFLRGQQPHQRRVARLRLASGIMRETNQLSGHAQSPLGVGACLPLIRCPSTATPSLRSRYRTSSLLWATQTSWRSSLPPRYLGLSEAAPLLRRPRQDLHGYRTFALSSSMRPGIPGECDRLAFSSAVSWPADFVKPSALSIEVFRDYILHRDISSLFHLAQLSCLRINHVVTAMTARLDTGPVASSYPGGPSLEPAALPCRNHKTPTDQRFFWPRNSEKDS